MKWNEVGPGDFRLPTLYAQDSKGGTKQWTVSVLVTESAVRVCTIFGKKGGNLQEQHREITEGKNIGKANETTRFKQAMLESESDFKKKLDKGYSESEAPTGVEVQLPMLAHDFHKRKHNIIYPCGCQPKLNGVRALAHCGSPGETGFFTSRMGKPFDAANCLRNDVEALFSSSRIPDGEIYNHDLSFQEIIRRVKKYRPGLTEELQYWCYDMADVASNFGIRDVERYPKKDGKLKTIGGIEVMVFGQVVLVPTFMAQNEDSIKRYHDMFVAGGFEGAIVRNLQAPYVFNHRSQDLQKYKEFEDAEFEIIGGFEGTGTEDGCIVFEVKGANGAFKVRPRGSHDSRRELMGKLPLLIGKQLTVRYQELSEDGIPIFPVGIAIRDYE